MALYLKNEDWRLITEKVTKETDPKRLMTLIAQLCHALVKVTTSPASSNTQKIRPSLSPTPRNPQRHALGPLSKFGLEC